MAFCGDKTAEDFEVEALPHLNDLYRTALRLAANSAEAEDLVQDVYMQAWKSFHRFELGTNCRAWLFKILINKNMKRSRKWFALARKSSEVIEGLPYEPPVPEQISDQEVLLGLRNIPTYYREVILLTDVEDFSYKQTADILAVPIGTVMSRLSRGRKLLRIELANVAPYYGIKNATQVENVVLSGSARSSHTRGGETPSESTHPLPSSLVSPILTAATARARPQNR